MHTQLDRQRIRELEKDTRKDVVRYIRHLARGVDNYDAYVMSGMQPPAPNRTQFDDLSLGTLDKSHSELLDLLTQQLNSTAHANRERVLVELSRVAYANLSDAFGVDDEGQLILDSQAIKETLGAALSKIDITTTTTTNQEGVTTTKQQVKLGLYDKLKAMDLIGKTLGMFGEGSDDDLIKAFIIEAQRRQAEVVEELNSSVVGSGKVIDNDPDEPMANKPTRVQLIKRDP